MTRPETLVRQLAEAALQPLRVEAVRIQRTPAPVFPVTPEVRRLWAAYRAARRQAARLEARLKALHATTYSSNGRVQMRANEQDKQNKLAANTRRQEAVRALRAAAMLAVLGLDAKAARPTVLKLKADLEKV